MQAPLQVICKRPLADICTCSALLDISNDHVRQLIDDGTLRAFNIARKGGSYQTLRVLAGDVAAFQSGNSRRSADFDSALEMIFPLLPQLVNGSAAKLSASFLARKFNVGSEHIIQLCKDGLLRFMPGTRLSCGPTGSPEVEFASIVAFLRSRFVQ